MAAPSPELKTYYGNCHCAAFKFSVKLPELKSVRTCNCSFCSRNAYKWIFPPPEENFILERGSIDDLAVYEFGEKKMSHYFCKKCGSSVISRYKPAPFGLNVRMLRDVDVDQLEDNPFPGKDLKSSYVPPTFPAHPEVEAGKKIYNGHCHCGAVTIAVKFKPVEEMQLLSCNCSLCSRNGELYIYPPTSAVTILTGDDKLTEYAFLSDKSLHTFCNVCGVSVVVKVLEDGDPVCPVNTRTFVDVYLEAIKVKKYDGASSGSPYVVA